MNLLSFKTAIRNLQKDKYQSFLNIFGLALGFAAFLYISTYFFQENNYDQFHSKSDHLYRIVTKVKMGDTRESLSNSESPIAFTAKKEIPEVIDATRFFYRNNIVVQVEDQKYLEKTFWYADANVFQLFDFNLLEGDINEALSKPYTVVITKDLSKKYFGDANPIGKTIELTDDGNTYEITGILDDIPASSHLQFGMLASLSTADFSSDYNIYQWGNFRDLFSYVLLENDVDLKTMNQKLQDFTIGYYVPMMKRVGIDYNEFEKNGNFVIHSFQPLKDIHLGTTFIDKAIVHGNKQLLYALALIGIMVIVIASFNFINLGTARATLRAKEISIKKIVGSGKKKIVGQLLFETLLQCFLALGIALIILAICLSIFNSYTGLSFNFNQFFTITGTMSLLTILLVVVALTGVFPSLAISRYNPVDVIRGSVLNWNSKSGLRSVLVSFQFVIFIILVFGTIVVKRQVGLLHHQNPGFQKENILVVKNTNKLGNNRNAFKEELQKNPLVVDAAYSNSLPSMFNGSSNPFSKVDDKKNQIFLLRLLADEDFLNTMKIKLLNGRNFTNDFDIEKNNAIINQKAAEIFGWADCNNKIIYDFNDGGRNYNVIGIVDDFHLESLREHKRPMIIRYRSSGDYLSLRIRPESASQMVSAIHSLWNEMNDQALFEYAFLDESFDSQYKQEVRFGKLISLFSILSIVIACLGMLGLVAFTLTRKQKEIGVRKVNGARIVEILAMLNKDFVKWVVISFIIATPVAYYAMYKWLENFAYKTTLSWWIFALAGLLALGIALITVSWQSWRAATRNPVEALRYE